MGVTFMDIGLPNQAYQAGVEWADDPSLNRDDNVRTSGVRDPVQRWAKKGQSSVAIISSSPELLLILVGWFPNNIQRLTRICTKAKHKKTLQPYESGIDVAILQ